MKDEPSLITWNGHCGKWGMIIFEHFQPLLISANLSRAKAITFSSFSIPLVKWSIRGAPSAGVTADIFVCWFMRHNSWCNIAEIKASFKTRMPMGERKSSSLVRFIPKSWLLAAEIFELKEWMKPFGWYSCWIMVSAKKKTRQARKIPVCLVRCGGGEYFRTPASNPKGFDICKNRA